jgi:deazaflavin-dependent oxidoreductase (nitroreductase family)
MTETPAELRTQPRPIAPPKRAPWIVRASNPLTRRLIRLGLPMGPNVLLTVRGRKSGLDRTAPVAVVEIDGRSFVIGAYGEADWVRNLRAAGKGTVRLHGREVPIAAEELEPAAALGFYARTLPGFIARLPWFGRAFAAVFFRVAAPVVLKDPATAAASRPVFELQVDVPSPSLST